MGSGVRTRLPKASGRAGPQEILQPVRKGPGGASHVRFCIRRNSIKIQVFTSVEEAKQTVEGAHGSTEFETALKVELAKDSATNRVKCFSCGDPGHRFFSIKLEAIYAPSPRPKSVMKSIQTEGQKGIEF